MEAGQSEEESWTILSLCLCVYKFLMLIINIHYSLWTSLSSQQWTCYIALVFILCNIIYISIHVCRYIHVSCYSLNWTTSVHAFEQHVISQSVYNMLSTRSVGAYCTCLHIPMDCVCHSQSIVK